MSYKWKPSKTARREFAKKMSTDSQFAADYYARKEAKREKKKATSKFDYNTAGGEYIPTQYQYDRAIRFLIGELKLSTDEIEACEIVISGYSSHDKVHHDYIHIVNELIRHNP